MSCSSPPEARPPPLPLFFLFSPHFIFSALLFSCECVCVRVSIGINPYNSSLAQGGDRIEIWLPTGGTLSPLYVHLIMACRYLGTVCFPVSYRTAAIYWDTRVGEFT